MADKVHSVAANRRTANTDGKLYAPYSNQSSFSGNSFLVLIFLCNTHCYMPMAKLKGAVVGNVSHTALQHSLAAAGWGFTDEYTRGANFTVKVVVPDALCPSKFYHTFIYNLKATRWRWWVIFNAGIICTVWLEPD